MWSLVAPGTGRTRHEYEEGICFAYFSDRTLAKKPRHRSGAEKSHQVARQAGGPARPNTESRLRARRVAVVKACRVRDHVDSVVWWAHQDSNLGQTGYEPAALTAELWARALDTPRALPDGRFDTVSGTPRVRSRILSRCLPPIHRVEVGARPFLAGVEDCRYAPSARLAMAGCGMSKTPTTCERVLDRTLTYLP